MNTEAGQRRLNKQLTICEQHGWGVVHRHGDVYALCDPWWKVMSEAFAPHSKVAVALISDHEEASKRFRVDTTRAPHWVSIENEKTSVSLSLLSITTTPRLPYDTVQDRFFSRISPRRCPWRPI